MRSLIVLRKIVLTAGGIICLFGLSRQTLAQDTTMTVTVTHVAGSNVYLEIGTNHGVSAGDTLLVRKRNEITGRLKVLSASSKQSVVAFVGQPFSLTRASRLSIVLNRSVTGSAHESSQASDRLEENTSFETERTAVTGRSTSKRLKRIELKGRLMMSLSVMDSETIPQAVDVSPLRRKFVTPSLNLNATVDNLPPGVRLRLNLRTDYRYSSASTLSRENVVRAYQLGLEKDLPFGQLQLGRFYNRLTPSGGYWDGISFLYGSRKKGIGAAAGFMPDRSNEGFSTALPRFSGFAHFETGRKNERPFYRISASYHEIQPNTLYLDRRYVGLEQAFEWGPVSLTQDLQLDRDPATDGWVVSQLRAYTRIKVVSWVSVRNLYTIRQPFRMYSTASPFSVRRDMLQSGLNFQFFDVRVGVSYAARYTGRVYESRTYSAYLTTPPVSPAQIVFFSSFNQWKSDFGTALYVNGGLSKLFGPALIRIDYGFYRSTNSNQLDPIDLQRYTVSVTTPLGNKLYLNARASIQRSRYLNSTTFNTSLQYRF